VENTPASLLYSEADMTGAIALVIGSEGSGMSRLARETCDFLVKLPMRGQIESLNASVACGLIIYEAWRARGFESQS
jgi:23S rRNA (guanosine2251-2'-O)-methyltransferase